LTLAKLLLKLNCGLLFLSGTFAACQRVFAYVSHGTHLVKQETAAFWNEAEVQTQVWSVLSSQYTLSESVEKTYMLEQPAVAAASVTHCRTQAEMLALIS
jgi:hypothetical protein